MFVMSRVNDLGAVDNKACDSCGYMVFDFCDVCRYCLACCMCGTPKGVKENKELLK